MNIVRILFRDGTNSLIQIIYFALCSTALLFGSAAALAQQPDLIVQNVTVTPSTVVPGASVSVGFTIRNQGAGNAIATESVIRFVTSSTSCPGTNLG